MTERNTLGEFSKLRGYFEKDDEFPYAHMSIPWAYERASMMAATSARRAIQSGSKKDFNKATWWDAVASTLEQVLVLSNLEKDVSINLPEPPKFK